MQATDTQAPTPNTNPTAYPEGSPVRGIVEPAVPAFDTPCVGLEGTMSYEDSTHYAGGDNEPTAPPAPFCIDSQDRAEWLLQKLANNAAEKARIEAQAAAMIARLDADTQRLNQRFGAELEAWTRQELGKRKGKVKSIITLQGTVGFRTSPSRLVIVDTDAALVHAHAAHLTKTEVATAAYLAAAKKQMEETGELLPGTAYTEPVEKFSISYKGGD